MKYADGRTLFCQNTLICTDYDNEGKRSLPFFLKIFQNIWCGAIAKAVSRRLPIAAARVRSPVRSCGMCGGQSGTGAGFLQVLRFPLPILIPPTTPHSSSVIRGCYNRPNIDRRTRWTQSHPTPRH
jgi:hypothetical protein